MEDDNEKKVINFWGKNRVFPAAKILATTMFIDSCIIIYCIFL